MSAKVTGAGGQCKTKGNTKASDSAEFTPSGQTSVIFIQDAEAAVLSLSFAYLYYEQILWATVRRQPMF